MDSIIIVAQITGSRPALRAAAARSFCAMGTRSWPSSTPRSPRAIMSECDSAMMESMFVSACGFSILGQILGRFSAGMFMRSMMSMSSCRSAAFCTNETQKYSGMGSSESMNSASSMSLAGSAAQSISTSGALTPLRALTRPPLSMTHLSSDSLTFSVTFMASLPSSMSSVSPADDPFTKATCSMVAFMVMRPGLVMSFASFMMPNSTTSPSATDTASSLSVSPTRNLGPCRSPRTSILREVHLAISARSRG
mmetsp:Transcript_12636/g.42202  ORF Transcript_12636/g.42202 Transcript_12636/m.42202 type:complete len:252 (-) Transcript_12636:293-1048(-)